MTHEPEIAVMRIGQGREPLVVVDNFFPDPEILCSAARAASFVPARNAYPGLRAPLPDCYWSEDRLQLMSSAIERSFGLAGPIRLIDASFSILTTPPKDLSVAQRLPHCDAFVPNQIALVHYLLRDSLDGTAFYRHRSTGFEAIIEHFRQIYTSQIDFELRHFGIPPAEYILTAIRRCSRKFCGWKRGSTGRCSILAGNCTAVRSSQTQTCYPIQTKGP